MSEEGGGVKRTLHSVSLWFREPVGGDEGAA